MSKVSGVLDNLRVADYKIGGSFRKNYDPTSDRLHLWSKSTEEHAAKRLKNIEGNLEALNDRERDKLAQEIALELDAAIASWAAIESMAERVCAGASLNEVATERELQSLFVWGPHAHVEALDGLLYKDREEIDAMGGVKNFMRNRFVRELKTELDSAFQYGQKKAELFKNMLSICAVPEFLADWNWLLPLVRVGEVAILEYANVVFSVEGGAVLHGTNYDHPLLGGGERDFFPSSHNSSNALRTSQIVKIWPGGNIVRTISRFYLLPNGLDISAKVAQVLDEADNNEQLLLIRNFEKREKPVPFIDEDRTEYRAIAAQIVENYRLAVRRLSPSWII